MNTSFHIRRVSHFVQFQHEFNWNWIWFVYFTVFTWWTSVSNRLCRKGKICTFSTRVVSKDDFLILANLVALVLPLLIWLSKWTVHNFWLGCRQVGYSHRYSRKRRCRFCRGKNCNIEALWESFQQENFQCGSPDRSCCLWTLHWCLCFGKHNKLIGTSALFIMFGFILYFSRWKLSRMKQTTIALTLVATFPWKSCPSARPIICMPTLCTRQSGLLERPSCSVRGQRHMAQNCIALNPAVFSTATTVARQERPNRWVALKELLGCESFK